MERTNWQDWVTALVGVILVAIPFVLTVTPPGGGSSAMITSGFVITGLLAIALGGLGIATRQSWEEWATLILGLWLLAMPWLLGFAALRGPTYGSVAGGLVLLVMGGLALWSIQQEQHG